MAEFALRPLSLGELLDRTFTILRRRFGAIMLILICCLIVPGLMVLNSIGEFMKLAPMADPSKSQEAQMMAAFALFGRFALIGLVASVAMLIARTALGWITHQAMLGREPDVMEALTEGFRRFFPMLGLLIIETAIMIGVEIVLYIPMVIFGVGATFAGGGTPGAGAFLGVFGFMALYFIVILYIFASLFVTSSALIAEPTTGVFKALERSWTLTAGRRWQIIGTMVLLYVLSWIVLMGAALTVGVGMGLARRGPESSTGWMVGIFGAAMLFGLVVFGFYYILQMVTYYDLRVRKEGLDLELASAAIPAA